MENLGRGLVITWKLSQGEPGRRLMPPSGRPTWRAKSAVLRQGPAPRWQASWHSVRRSATATATPSPAARGVDDRKHSVMFHSRQIEPLHSPLMHSWVPGHATHAMPLLSYLGIT